MSIQGKLARKLQLRCTPTGAIHMSNAMIRGMSYADLFTAKLRIIATSDLHMHVMAYDYYTGQLDHSGSLSALVEPIFELRRTAASEDQGRACVLVDNGDLLQGNPLADHLAQNHEPDRPHPLAQAMNTLGYDAVGLGNHDLDYGLQYIAGFARDLHAPLVSSNLRLRTPAPWFVPHTVIQAGKVWIGIVSVLPPATTKWATPDVSERIEVAPMVAAVKRTAAETRVFGADVVLALCHTGLGTDENENALDLIARDGGVDAIVGGHTHREFPVKPPLEGSATDQDLGTIAGVPVVMPGFGGGKLGCIDLDLESNDGRNWRVASKHVCLVPSRPRQTPIAPPLLSLGPTHDAAAQSMEQTVGQIDEALTSYFAQIASCRMLNVLAQAQWEAIQRARAETEFASLPMVSVVSAMRAGGLAGPTGYVDISPGAVRQRHLCQMLPFSNALTVIKTTTAGLREWLEKAAACFHQVRPDRPNQILINPDVPAFDFDVAFGCTYRIDPSQPSRYRPDGSFSNSNAHRIHDLCLDGKALSEDQTLLVAVNSYRAGGGGNFPVIGPKVRTLTLDAGGLAITREYFANQSAARTLFDPPWRFHASVQGVPAIYETGPGAVQHLNEIKHLLPDTPKKTSNGFVHIPITL